VTTALVGTQAEEQTTEAITGWGQGGVEAEAGMRDKAPTFLEAFKESVAPTFWQTMLMQMTGHVAHNMYESWNDLGLKKDPAPALPTDDEFDLTEVAPNEAQAPKSPASASVPAAPASGGGIGGRVNELASQLQELGSAPPVDEEFDITDPDAARPAPGEAGVAPAVPAQPQAQPVSVGEIRGMTPPVAETQGIPEAQGDTGQNIEELVNEVADEVDDIEIHAHQAATSPFNDLRYPTRKQLESGKYKMAHVRAQGFDVSIENPAGSARRGVDQDGNEWSVTMKNHYGYLKGTVGADKDHLDVFLGPDPRGGDIFVVDQVDPNTGKFDEHKVIMGVTSEDEARDIYLSNYEDGWQGLGAITRMPLGTFRKWARSSKTKRPVGDIPARTTPVDDQNQQNLSNNGPEIPDAVVNQESAEGSTDGSRNEEIQERDDEQRRPVEPGLEQHGSEGVQQPVGGRSGERRVRGRRGTVHFPGGSEAFTYEVIDADELIPSHDPRTAFTPREEYGYINERDYERNEYEQGKVVEHAMELEPDLLLSDSPTAEHGGPLVDSNNRVLGGNSRAMTLQVAYDRDMDGAARYKAALVRNADRFGLDKDGIESMARPVLVRAMDRGVERDRAQSLIPEFNAGFTQAVDPEALGVSRGAKVSDDTITVLAEGLEDGQTLRDYLSGPKAKRLVESLIEDGALDRTRLTAVMRGGETTPEGRDEIERILRGRLVGDYGIIEGLQPSLLEALDASIPALVRLQGRGEGWDISKQFMAALRHVSRYRKNKSADSGSLDVYFRTPDMMGGIPGKKSRVVQILAHAIDNMGHAQLGKSMRDFTTLAFAGQKSVGLLPGMGKLLPTRDQAMEKFRTEKTPGTLFDGAQQNPGTQPKEEASQAAPPLSERDEYEALFDEELAAAQAARARKKETVAERQRRTREVAKKVAPEAIDVHAAQQRALAGAKKMADGAMAALEVFSKYGGMSVREVKEGDKVNQNLYDELKPHLMTVMDGAREMGLAGKDLAREVVRFLIKTFGDKAERARPFFMKFVDEEILNKERENVDQQRGSEDLERDSGTGQPQDVVGKKSVPDERGRTDRTGGQGVRGTGEQGRGAGSDPGVSGRAASADGARGDSRVREEASGTAGRPAGSELGERGDTPGDGGLAVEPVGDVAVERAVERSAERVVAKEPAKSGEQKKGDLENISRQLPTLLQGQHQDVAFAEQRFEKGAGVMFTNGTGTGKTGSGLGIVQRLVRAGKDNILIAVPADSIAKAWISFAEKYLGLKVSQLKNTKDAGQGVVVTTHANMGMNNALASRDWDLIVMDEAHKSMSSENANLTRTLQSLRALALHRDGYYDLAKMRYPEAYAAAMDKDNQWRDSDPQSKKDRALAIKKRWDDLVAEVKTEVQAAQGTVKSVLDGDGGRPGVVFLSATPFAYATNVDYAEGFLFDYPQTESKGYNQPNGQQSFMIQHFGYRMRTGKLTKPEADVDSGFMERQFNSWLDVEHDYDRRFVLVDSAVGRTIDEGLQWLRENKRFYPLADLLNERFDYHTRQYLLEAIKANEAVPLIQQHLDLGRKVVVFHDFKQGGGFNPFDVSMLTTSEDEVSIRTDNGKSYTVTIGELAREFTEKRPDLQELPLASFRSPITTLSQAFPDLLLFNGDVSPKNRAAAIESFQDDASGKNLILVQSAAGEAGISLHDTTGKHQRVLINLGMPTRPVTAIQQEGRIFRVGQQSNAMFRYLNTGTNWERWAFAGTIARRASTAENLSLGEEARALRDGFIQAFEESDAWAPGHEGEGTGGKDRDRAANQALTEWDRAKTMYFAQQRKNSRTKAAEGVDYFATPEPLGLKMVEWAGLTAGMDVLEPSAGHGAIARWFPDLASKTSIEPSHELASRLALVTDGRIVTGTFEGLHINNKYDAIVMNPPFGHGGKTAMEHVAKAFTHLREGGRIVAIVPNGPSMEKRFDAWYDSEQGKSAYLRMTLELPAVAFERAGTKVRASVIVIDKAEKPIGDVASRSTSEIGGETIKEFFDNLENRTAPDRVQTEEGQARRELEEADSARGVFFEPAETKHTKTGADLFVAKKTGGLSYDAFRKIKGIAKSHGGWWSSFQGKGAIPGFQFKERSKRDEFLAKAAKILESETKGVRLLRSDNPSEKGLRASRVRGIVAAISGSWTSAPPVKVVQSVRDLPANLLNAVRKAGAEGDVEGVYHDGVIYIVADRMKSAVHVHRTVLHEAAGHHGLRLIMTEKELSVALDAAWKNREVKASAQEIADVYGLDLENEAERREAVEEVLANWAETGVEEKALDRFIAAVRRALRRVFPHISLSDGEIRDLIVRARAAVEDGKGVRADTEVNRFRRGAGNAAQAVSGMNTPMTPAQIAEELEKDRTFANKVHEGRDLVRHQVRVTAADMQREVQLLAGSKKWKYNPLKIFSSEKELTDSARSRLLDAAMLVYRDLQINPDKADEFRAWAREQLDVKRVKGRDRLRIREQLRVLEAAENLTAEQKDFVDNVMDDAFSIVGNQASAAGVVATLLDNYVRRLWNRPQDADKAFSGAGHAFKVFTTASKARTLETIADGWMKGYDLQIKGITSSWSAIAGEIGEIVANKSFIQEGRRQGIFSTRRQAGYAPLKATGFRVWARKAGVKIRMAGNYGELGADGMGRSLYVAPPNQVWAVYAKPGDRRADTLFDRENDARAYAEQLRQSGSPKAYVEFRQEVDIFERVPLYAPARVAELVNRMTRSMDGDSAWKAPLPRTILQFNNAAKAWILMTSFFHHLAGSRSWAFGVNHGVMEAVRRGDLREAVSRAAKGLNPVSAHKRGLEKIKSNNAVLRELVRNGLVLGEMADWSEGILSEHRGLTERMFTLMSGRVPGAEKAVAMVQAGKLFREKAANSLFKRLFAGLKAEAACVEFAHQMKLEIAAANKAGRVPNAKLVAERVARLINSDFGGLHLARMGRMPGVQSALRLLLLAPDWTESNWRTVTGTIPGLNKAVARAMHEVPGPPGMDKVFRRFWGGIILKGAASTLLLQIAVTSLFGDDDDSWLDMYREQFADWDTFRRMRWTGVDVTPIYRRLGVDVPKGERKIFSIVGHFADFLRLMDPESLIKGKMSPVMRVAGSLGTKTDYRQRPYTGFSELLKTGQTVKRSYHQPTETFFAALPSIILAQARDIQPIQVGYLLKYIQGEEDGLTALLSSAGAHMKAAYTPDLVGKDFEAAGQEINATYRRMKELQELVRVHAAMLQTDPAGAAKLKTRRADDFKEAESFLRDKAAVLHVRENYEEYQDVLSEQRKRRRLVETYQMDDKRRSSDIDSIDVNMDALKKNFLENYWRKAK
jgi:ATP:corrinoid adenosyltransferase